MSSFRIKAAAAAAVIALALGLAACSGGEAMDGTYIVPVGTPPAPTREAEETSVPDTAAPPASETGPAESQTAVPTETEVPVITEPALPGALGPEDFRFEIRGRAIGAGMAFDPEAYRDAWGEPRTEKGQACIGGGFDINYYYGETLAVFTLGDSGEQIIYDLILSESGYRTARGAVIGTSRREEVRALYGEPDEPSPAADSYYFTESLSLTFTYSGGLLTEIELYDSPQF